MTTFEIIVIIFLYLIWAQHSKLVDILAMRITILRRRVIMRVKGDNA
jgi:hypothetical protein